MKLAQKKNFKNNKLDSIFNSGDTSSENVNFNENMIFAVNW